MIELRGITEIIGESGTGKSLLALSICNDVTTLYISQSQIKFSYIPQSIILKRINNFLDLKIFINYELKTTIKYYKIKKIILDGLENYLYVFDNPRTFSKDIFQIITILKELCFINNINIIIINGYYKIWEVEGIKITNRYFGLPWEYLINTRYLIKKTHNTRTIELIKGHNDYIANFYIDDKGAHLERVNNGICDKKSN